MKRVLVTVLTAVLAVGLAATGAEAKKGSKKKKKAQAVPTSQKIAESMGNIHWGMTKDELMKYFTDKLREKYRPLLAKAKDAVEDDNLRQQARRELDALNKGYVEFDGHSTGWDVSFLKGEFTQGNDESMIVVRDGNSQNFYFMIGGKLWKWYKAFDASVFPAGNFDTFAGSVQRRFGNGKDVEGEVRPGEGRRHWIEWQDKQTRLRAVDETGFYGFYSLVFEEKATVDKLARLRSHDDRSQSGEKTNSLVDAVTSDRSGNPDDSPNIVDRITGRLHQNAAPSQGSEEASAGKTKTKSKAKSSSSSSEGSGVTNENDPISGLGL